MIYSQTWGAGPHIVVFLHGFLGSQRNIASLAKAFALHNPLCTSYSIDLPGHGQSPPLPSVPTLATVVAQLVTWAKGLPTLPAAWVGHSLGGRLALATAEMLPAPLVLLDISPSNVSHAVEGIMGELLHRFFNAPATANSRTAMRIHLTTPATPVFAPILLNWLLTNLVAVEHEGRGYVRWRVDREQLWLFHQQQAKIDLWPKLIGLRQHVPITCIRGEMSNFVTTEDVSRFQLQQCLVHTVAGADHFLHTQAFQQVLNLLLEVL